jgi:hypothetical protein
MYRIRKSAQEEPTVTLTVPGKPFSASSMRLSRCKQLRVTVNGKCSCLQVLHTGRRQIYNRPVSKVPSDAAVQSVLCIKSITPPNWLYRNQPRLRLTFNKIVGNSRTKLLTVVVVKWGMIYIWAVGLGILCDWDRKCSWMVFNHESTD